MENIDYMVESFIGELIEIRKKKNITTSIGV